MFRSLLPTILASLGFTLLTLAGTMTFLVWQISDTGTDLPSTYKVDIYPRWENSLGESLLDSPYLFYRVAAVRSVGKYPERCPLGNLNFVAKRSQNDEQTEQISLKAGEFLFWLSICGLIEIILSGIYIWWFTISYEHRSVVDAISFTLAAVVFCGILFVVLQSRAPFLNYGSGPWADDCRGTITFIAKLSKIYYQPLVVCFAGIALELGALGVMARQIIKSLIGRKEFPKLAVG